MKNREAKTGTGRKYSLRWLARVLGIDRSVLSDRLTVNGIHGTKGKKNSKLFLLRDAIEVSLDLLPLPGCNKDDSDNPDDWSPAKRKTHYEAEIQEIRFKKSTGELIPVDEARLAYTDLFRGFVSAYQGVAEALQEDPDVGPEQMALIQEIVDREQEALQTQVIAYGESIRHRETGDRPQLSV